MAPGQDGSEDRPLERSDMLVSPGGAGPGVHPAELMRLVGEETRHALLSALIEGERTVSQLVAALADEQSNVSHHLGILREAGLVAARRSGRTQVYRIADAEVARLLGDMEALAGRLDRLAYSARLGLPVGPGFQGYG